MLLQRAIRYRFGQFELDPAEGKLSRSGSRVKLQDLPFRLLVLLVERPGEIVTREEVRQRLWPQDTFVEFDNSLGVAVRKLREALRDDADAPRFVETVPRRGYRFVAPVTVRGCSGSSRSSPSRRTKGANKSSEGSPVSGGDLRSGEIAPSRSRYWIIAALVLLMVGITVYEFRPRPTFGSPPPKRGRFRRTACGLAARWRCWDSATWPDVRKTTGSRPRSLKC